CSSDLRARCRVMTPLECVARLVALVPPPRYPLSRPHGVLAPRHKWRSRIVPRPPPGSGRSSGCDHRDRAGAEPSADRPRSPAPTSAGPRVAPPVSAVPRRGDGRIAFVEKDHDGVPLGPRVPSPGGATHVAPNVLSLAHWARLDDGALYAPPGRMEWALLLRRTWNTDALRCPHCLGRLR